MKTKHFLHLIFVLSLIIIISSLKGALWAASVVVSSTTDVSDGDTTSIINLMSSPGSDGVISLREAITAANNTPNKDTISFNIPGAPPFTIQPASALPVINDPLVIDGTTQPGYTTSPIIELDGSMAGSGSNGLHITAGNSTIKGLVINNFGGDGLRISGNGDNLVDKNYIGTDPTGMSAKANGNGLTIDNSPNNTIGVPVFGEPSNVISGNGSGWIPNNVGYGLQILGSAASGNIVQNNYIGMGAYPLDSLPNRGGLLISGAPNNIIGGSDPYYRRNLISGNEGYGLLITGTGATGNLVDGNLIGYGESISDDNALTDLFIQDAPHNTISNNTFKWSHSLRYDIPDDPDLIHIKGASAVGNVVEGNALNGTTMFNFVGDGGNGIKITGAPLTQIGGTGDGEGNAISNVANGVIVLGTNPFQTIIQGNSIYGCKAAGVNLNTNNNLVGGTADGAGNLIKRCKIGVQINSDYNTVQGNHLLESVQIDHINQIRDPGVGVEVIGDFNLIGGAAAGAGNLISGTLRDYPGERAAVELKGDNNKFQGNFVGTNAEGTAAYQGSFIVQVPPYGTVIITGNHVTGIDITGSNNLIGGTTGVTPGGSCTGACNVISANGVSHFHNGLELAGATGNTIQGNHIGVDVTGMVELGNTRNGLYFYNSNNNIIGGQGPSQGNIIANSVADGINMYSAVNNIISGNAIFDNDELGIDLVETQLITEPEVTPNDTGDGDSGGNKLQNYPVLTTATTDGQTGITTVAGTLNSVPNTTYTVEFFSNDNCDASGYGEGQDYLEAISVVTDASGNASFLKTLSSTVPGSKQLTATATDPDGNTSEFSACQAVVYLNQPPIANDDIYSTNEDTILSTAAPGVLSNDMDPDGDSLTAVPDSTTSDGTSTLNGDGSFTYTPDADYCGSDGFTYHANDGLVDSNVATVSIDVICVNDPPVLTVDQTSVTVDEGNVANNSGTVSDVDSASITLSASVGTVTDNGDGTWSWSFTTSDGPAESQTVIIYADDGEGGTATDTFVLSVNNVAPTITSIAVPTDPVNIKDQPLNASADFSDPAGSNDAPYSCTVDYGDGNSPQAGTVSGFTCTGPDQTYGEAGVYSVTLTVTDKDGGSDTATTSEFIVIFDPDGGFVTGGGWINSPEGAYTPNPGLVGKATFGFVSKYKKGAEMPVGNTEFQFHAGDLNFHSDSYQWLVIAGHKAMYKGTGTINGSGNYGFLLSAVDAKLTPSADIDKFRFKIWDKDNGDAIIYDNQLGDDEYAEASAEIAGGSIVIQKN
jgi:hypothetical protein